MRLEAVIRIVVRILWSSVVYALAFCMYIDSPQFDDLPAAIPPRLARISIVCKKYRSVADLLMAA